MKSTIRALEADHFFAETLGFDCVDDQEGPPSTVADELERRIGRPKLWDQSPSDWSADDLFDLIEVFHDLATRPTRGWFHSYCNCGWHPGAFSRRSGQALYRWRINEILDRSGLGLRLADDGEDVGRLVRATPAELTTLVEEAITVDGDDGDEIAHAIALFRTRGGGRNEMRSAVVALARILEARRATLKTELFTKDAGTLFGIANNFDLRHRTASQQADYPEAFLEWIFYWYLATIRLLDSLAE